MKKKITGAFALIILLTGLISVYAFVKRERSLELHWLTENSRSQLDLMGDLLQNDLEKMKNQLAQVATLMESGQVEEAQKNLGVFIGVAALNSETSEFIWKTQAPRRADVNQNDEWAAQWIQKTKEVKSEDSELKFFVSQSPQGEIRSALSVQANVRDHRTGQVNKVRLIGIRSQALFQDYIDKLKVQGIHTFLTTQTGLTLAHSVSEYVGNSMLGDRTYEQIRAQKSVFGTIITQDVRGDDILSFYVKLPDGKLTLVSQWRKELWLATDWTFYGQGLFFILALSLLSGALAQFLLKRYESELLRKGLVREMIRDISTENRGDETFENIAEKKSKISSADIDSMEAEETVTIQTSQNPNVSKTNLSHVPASATYPTVPSPIAGSTSLKSTGSNLHSIKESTPLLSRPPLLFATPLATPEIREPQVSMKILDKVVAVLRAPLLSVLGHVQMARLNPHGGALQSIETEVRNAKEILDQVGQFSGQAHIPSVTVPLYEVVESALRNVEGSILRNNIKIIRDISSDLAVKCDVDDLKVALSSLFKNAIESMENSLRKNLFIRASKVNNTIQLEIEDTGEGMSSENLEKCLDPFFTTRSTLDHIGLGLSMVSGILRQHLAQLQLKSKLGEGTTVIVKLPTSQEIVQPLANCFISKTTPKIDPSVTQSPLNTQTQAKVPIQTLHPTSTRAGAESINSIDDSIEKENDIFKSLNLFDEDDAIGEFQFGRLEFSEDSNPKDELIMKQSLGEKAAQEVIQAAIQESLKLTSTEKEVMVSPSPSKRLKKKEETLSNIKVHIPRPEEKL